MPAIGLDRLTVWAVFLIWAPLAQIVTQAPASGQASDLLPLEITPTTVPTTLPSIPLEESQALSRAGKIQISGFAFTGNTTLSSKELSAIAEQILNAKGGYLDSNDRELIRINLTKAYINAGYINSGAVLPEQTMEPDHIITYRIIEGQLSTIRFRGSAYATHTLSPALQPSEGSSANENQLKSPAAPGANPASEVNNQTGTGPTPWDAAGQMSPPQHGINWHLLNDGYVTDRVWLGAGTPLNVLKLKDQLELLRRDPNIKTINGELGPGDKPGDSVLDLYVTERNPFQFGLEFANNRPPSIGAYELNALAADSDLTGAGDSLSARWGVFAGALDSFDYNEDRDLSFDYARPLDAQGLAIDLNYTRSSDLVVEQPFNLVDITSRTESYNITLRQPIIRTVDDPGLGTADQELDAVFTVSSRSNETFLLGQPFSFSPGANDGKEDTFALRPGLEFVRRSTEAAIAIRGTFSFGLGKTLGSTLNNDGQPDSRFYAFLGQAQYAHRLPLGSVDQPWNDTQAILHFNTQLTPNRLLSLEQFSLGGMNTIRGYRENQLVTDMAVQASLQMNIPVAKSHQRDFLSVVPFIDSGYAWNRDNYTAAPELISSIGAGLVFTPTERITAQVYYGYRLNPLPDTGHDLQDMGFNFDVTILAF